MAEAIRAHATTRRVTQRSVIEHALQAYLHPRNEDARDAAIARRLQRIEGRLAMLAQNDGVTTETVGMLARVLLGLLPEPTTRVEVREFQEKMDRRWPRFLDVVTDVLVGEAQGIYDHLPKEMVAKASDFASAPQDAQPVSRDGE